MSTASVTPMHRRRDQCAFPLIVLVDDSDFTARDAEQLPVGDVHALQPGRRHARHRRSFTRQKHWGCTGSLVIDARIKPHHAPPLEEDPEVSRRVEELAAPGRPALPHHLKIHRDLECQNAISWAA